MILTEWNTEDAIAYARNEGREEGREEGWEKGNKEGEQKGEQKGIQKGEQKIINLLKSGKSPEEIIREYGGG